MKLFKIIGLILVLSPVVQVFGAAAGAFSEEIAAKSIKEDIKKPDDPMLFLDLKRVLTWMFKSCGTMCNP